MQINSHRGFTLIEVLIVSPIVILMIATFIGLAVITTGEALRENERNAMTFAIQSSLDSIEDDAYRAVSFPSTNGTFNVNTTTTLIVKAAATSTNPQSSSRNLVYAVPSSISPCPTTNLEIYDLQYAYYIYYLRDGTIWKRTIASSLPSGYNACPTTAWQKTSCFEGDGCTSSTQPRDIRILDDVSSVNYSFFTNPKSTSPRTCLGWPDIASPTTINANITLSKNIAGESVTKTESIRVSSVNVVSLVELGCAPSQPSSF